MTRAWLFLDEQGDIKFGSHNSTHFGVGIISTDDPLALTVALDAVRHRFWSTEHIPRGFFHAHADCYQVKTDVFETFRNLPILSCDVAVLRKDRIYPALRSPASMYRLATRFALSRALVAVAPYDELVIVAAEWPTCAALVPVLLRPASETGKWTRPIVGLQAPTHAHAGLQYADYLAWAAQRERTRQDGTWLEKTKLAGRRWSNFSAFES